MPQIRLSLRLFSTVICGVSLSLFNTSPVSAQTDPPKPRPKIGLALSGGAALGEAHLGVLEWFAEHHIPIDYITGASMGGLVGGLYATGMTPAEMRTFFKGLDWNNLLTSEPPFEALTYRRKQERRDVPTRLELGLRDGINLPSGLDPANPVGLLFSNVCVPYSSITSFDELPTPFRCMAVDLVKGVPVVLKDGPLDTALRATMATPGVFTPITRDGKQLIDGGLLDNIPTETLKAMGPDIIIAVDLAGDFGANKKFKSFVEVLSRSASVALYDNERRSLKLADIVLAPNIDGLTTTDFDKVDIFAERGRKAAEAKADVLNKLAVSDDEWKAYLAYRQARRRTTIPTATSVKIEGVSPSEARRLTRRLRPFLGAPLDKTKLDRTLTAITGEGRYESFQYEAPARGNGVDLVVRPTQRQFGPPFARFGLEVNGADSNYIQFNLASHFLATDVGAQGAEVWSDVRLGSDKQFYTEYYRPLSNYRIFIAPRISYLDTNQEFYQGSNRVAIYGNRTSEIGADIGYRPNRSSEVRLGYLFNHAEASVSTGNAIYGSLYGGAHAISLRYGLDTQDSPIIPTRGTFATLQSYYYIHAPGVSSPFPSTELRLNSFHPLIGGSVFGTIGVGTTFGTSVTPFQQFALGGPFRLGAYNYQELRGNDYLLLSGGYLHKVGHLPAFLGDKIMIGSWYEFGGAFQHFSSAKYKNSLSVGFLAETFLGPVVVGGSYGEGGRNNVWFALGRLF